MQIRKATTVDIPRIIPLLKKSLGESLMPKSEEFFNWKHQLNPFGPSKIIIAEHEQSIVGVRAFMYWNWVKESETSIAVRAVDTATDPAFQGKGIFTKLTMQAVHECAEEGVDFVFNTPNPVSKKGYLKMGWVDNGKMPMMIRLPAWIPRKYKLETQEALYQDYSIEQACTSLTNNWILPASATAFHTPLSHAYLDWRYAQCSVSRYGACIEPGKFGVVFRLKPLKGGFECRICELWTEQDLYVDLAQTTIQQMLRTVRPLLVTCAPAVLFGQGQINLAGMWGPYARGPVVTLRTLAQTSLSPFQQFSSWQPSLGSMELF